MHFPNRDHLPTILKERNLTALGVEVGVQRGNFAAHILANWPGMLYLVDPWRHLDNYRDDANVGDVEQEEIYKTAMRQCLAATGGTEDRIRVYRELSLDAAKMFATLGIQFDFVYIDADHSYAAAKADIEAWLPLVRPGGILAGHDFVPDGEYSYGSFGVKRAVTERFASDVVFVSQENDGNAPSWLVFV